MELEDAIGGDGRSLQEPLKVPIELPWSHLRDSLEVTWRKGWGELGEPLGEGVASVVCRGALEVPLRKEEELHRCLRGALEVPQRKSQRELKKLLGGRGECLMSL